MTPHAKGILFFEPKRGKIVQYNLSAQAMNEMIKRSELR
jgi:hypothetical protein